MNEDDQNLKIVHVIDNKDFKTIERCFYHKFRFTGGCNCNKADECCDCTPENLKKDCIKYKPTKFIVYDINLK